jgi:hypothetical protein
MSGFIGVMIRRRVKSFDRLRSPGACPLNCRVIFQKTEKPENYPLGVPSKCIRINRPQGSLHRKGRSNCALRHSMDHFEQRVVLKFLFLKGLRYKTAQIERSSRLGEQVYSLLQAKPWICPFKDGDLSSKDDDRSGRLFSDLSDGIQSGVFSCRYCIRIVEGKLEFQAQS